MCNHLADDELVVKAMTREPDGRGAAFYTDTIEQRAAAAAERARAAERGQVPQPARTPADGRVVR